MNSTCMVQVTTKVTTQCAWATCFVQVPVVSEILQQVTYNCQHRPVLAYDWPDYHCRSFSTPYDNDLLRRYRHHHGLRLYLTYPCSRHLKCVLHTYIHKVLLPRARKEVHCAGLRSQDCQGRFGRWWSVWFVMIDCRWVEGRTEPRSQHPRGRDSARPVNVQIVKTSTCFRSKGRLGARLTCRKSVHNAESGTKTLGAEKLQRTGSQSSRHRGHASRGNERSFLKTEIHMPKLLVSRIDIMTSWGIMRQKVVCHPMFVSSVYNIRTSECVPGCPNCFVELL